MKFLILILLQASLFGQSLPFGSMPIGSGGSSPTWSFVQDATNFACTTNPCTVTFSTATTAGSFIMVGLASATGTDTISTVSGGGGTWNLCSSSGCHVTNTNIGSGDVAYNITGTGGATAIAITDAASNPAFVAAIEIKCTANCGTIALDAIPNSFGNSTSCGTCTAAGFTGLTGISDAIAQMMNYNNTLSSPSGGYTLSPSGVFLYHVNSAVGTAPTATQTASGNFLATGVAIK
jgi:hypothetical protein